MASSISCSTTISLLLMLFSLSAAAKNHVCDPERLAGLGLDVWSLTFCDNTLPYEVRAKDLVDRMNVQEKADNLGNYAAGVPRLGIPAYKWWSEALHGVSDFGGGSFFDALVPGATSFPTPIVTAASFNTSLWVAIGQAVSTEARAMHNLGRAGLTFWSPNMNVVRDPRWGRALETPGEDPFVVGTYASSYVIGLQNVAGHETATDLNSRPLKVSACCKHYAAYDVDHWEGIDRTSFNANVTEQDMVETFLRPFEMCIKDGDVSSVMCSYNAVNGIPACADARLLRQTIRNDWNLHGYIVSDCDSVEVIYRDQKWLDDTQEDAVAQVLRAGLDLDCGSYYPRFLVPALMKGLIKEQEVDRALRNIYVVQMRLGLFDGSPNYESLGASDVCSQENKNLAAEAAREGIVLLKNKDTSPNLPLNADQIKKIAVIGPHANATIDMIGNYHGVPCRYVSPIEGLAKYAEVDYQVGCADVLCKNTSLIFPAMRAAQEADATIIFVGLNLDVEAEGLDRTDLLLPGYQYELVNQVSLASKGPVHLVIFTAGGVDVSSFEQNDKIRSILWAGYPGEEGGTAVADVIFGQYNPGGRLPLTWYEADYVNQLPMTAMNLRPVDEMGYPGRTYKFFSGSTIYTFGHGLSYTKFNYNVTSSQRSIKKKLAHHQHCPLLEHQPGAFVPPCHSVLVEDMNCEGNDIVIDVQVTNTRNVDGSDVVMLYSTLPDGIVGAPIKQVVGFKRIFVPAGESQTARFELNSCKTLSFVTPTAYTVIPAGLHTMTVGSGDNALPFNFNVQFSR